MLGWRLFLSAVMIPAFIGGFYLDVKSGPQAPVLLALALALGARAAWELCDLLKVRNFRPDARIVIGCTLVIVASNWAGRFWPELMSGSSPLGVLGPCMLAFTVSILVLFCNAAMRYREAGDNMETLAAELLTVSYVGVLLSLIAQLRWVAGSDAGYLALGSLIIATKAGDSGAYTLGALIWQTQNDPPPQSRQNLGGSSWRRVGRRSRVVGLVYLGNPLAGSRQHSLCSAMGDPLRRDTRSRRPSG